MFSLDFFIDSFQNTKKVIFNQIVSDAVLQKTAANYVDAQTTFAKMIINNSINMAKYSVDQLTSCWNLQKEQASQAPYKVEKEAN